MQEIKFVYTHEGAPVANSAWLVHRSSRIAVIDVDMASKYCHVGASVGKGVLVMASEQSLYLKDGVSRDLASIITFDLPGDWVFVASSGGRYTLTCVFMSTRSTWRSHVSDWLGAIGWRLSVWRHKLMGG